MTTRGLTESDFEKIAVIVDKAVQIAKKLETSTGKTKVSEFITALGDGKDVPEIGELQKEVKEWIGDFPVPWTS